MTLGFEEELRRVRGSTHKKFHKFRKKRGLEITNVQRTNGQTVYHVLKKDPEAKGGYRPLSIKIPDNPTEDP